ncbi:MAG: GAF domain-containing protein [Bacteroidetes bacterium]|nr:MAG: GAF domain-containing protein [Bacteroidota bacterium]
MAINKSVTAKNPVLSHSIKRDRYESVVDRLELLIDDSTDIIAAMATVVAELHNTFDHFHWTGFYRVTSPGHLQVGPYQGGHGCLEIPFARGICGAAARTAKTQLVPDVNDVEDHIACSTATQSEIVIPIITDDRAVLAVLDVDSDILNAFDQIDQEYLEAIGAQLGARFSPPASGISR